MERYGTGGFFYIAGLSTLIGVFLHYILNLSEIAGKDLFVMEFMANKMKTINMKEDPETIITISHTYEILNKDPEKLFSELTKETICAIEIHREREHLHGYSLGRPIEEAARKRRQDIIRQFLSGLEPPEPAEEGGRISLIKNEGKKQTKN